jgi:hypothetical protein
MKLNGVLFIGLAAILALFATITGVYAADVDVFAEAAFTESDLEICIYADINAANLISFGVSVSYDPGDLTVNTATDKTSKNELLWYFGNGGPEYPYMDPDTSTSGEVVVIGGKLDESAPTEGVGGQKVLLGKVRFNRNDSIMPLSTPIGISLGRGGAYKNFVDNAGNVKDGSGVSFATVTLYQRGDANLDGSLTNSDIFAISAALGDDDYSCIADCNDDGVLTNSDIFCLNDNL